MKPAFAGPALAAAAALALVYSPDPTTRPAAAAEPAAEIGTASDPLAATALGAIARHNGGELPPTAEGLFDAFRAVAARADVNGRLVPRLVQLPVPFSAVALDSGLTHPRILLTSEIQSRDLTKPLPPSGGWGGGSPPPLIAPQPPTAPNLEGRLFLAANTAPGPDGTPAVRVVEFISWNTRRLKFDFGVIEYAGGRSAVKFVDGARCFSCHKNRGPILGDDPWSNTTHNKAVRDAAVTALEAYQPWLTSRSAADRRFDGLSLIAADAPGYDAAVRRGAALTRNRELFRLLAKYPGGRTALAVMLAGLARPEEIDDVNRMLRPRVDSALVPQISPFRRDWANLGRKTPPDRLRDFVPADGSASPAAYDARRAAGDHALPPDRRPSSGAAFLPPPPPTRFPQAASEMLSVPLLAQTIGLTAGDRKFLADACGAAGSADPAAVAVKVVTGPAFADVLAGGPLPDREDFKDRFAAGLRTLAGRDRVGTWALARASYASAPNLAPKPGEEVKEVEPVPTTACLRCHEVRPAGKAGPEPIPALAFDPFDKPAREAWVNAADRKRKAAVLGRMLKRVGEDKDMPPEDSAEHDLFRAKDPAAFEEVRRFLADELRKAK